MPTGLAIGTAVLTTGGSIANGILGANAAKDAGQLQYQAAQDSLALQRDIYNNQVQSFEPLRQFGYSAINPLAGLLGLPTGYQYQPNTGVGSGSSNPTADQYAQYVASIPELQAEYNRVAREGNGFGVIPMDQYDFNGNERLDANEYGAWHYAEFGQSSSDPQYRDFFGGQGTSPGGSGGDQQAYGDSFTDERMDWLRQTPGYQFAVDEGNRNLAATAGLQGSLLSGDRAKAAIEYGQNLGTSVLNQERNALFTALGFGSAAAAQQSAAGAGYASGAANTLYNQGQAQADARLGQYQGINSAITGGINGATDILGTISRNRTGSQNTSSGGPTGTNNSSYTTPQTNPDGNYNYFG